MTVNSHMKRYIATLVTGHEFYVRAGDDHEAACNATDMAQYLGADLKDVKLDEPIFNEEGGLDGDALMWL